MSIVETAPADDPGKTLDAFAIQASDLRKVYSSGIVFQKKFEALKGITFDVRRGEVFGLLGPNGAGKTTFVKILLGIISKTSGTSTLMGHPGGSIAGRRLVGYLPEHLRISPYLTAYTALECYGNLSNVPNSIVRDKRDELLHLVGLTGRESESVKNFSKGMLQRLGLAQALLHDPKLLMMDEPTDGLDPRARAEMRQIIRQLRDTGVTIFLNSHLLQEVEMICDSVAILDHGNLRYCGDVASASEAAATGGGQVFAEVELLLNDAVSMDQAMAGFEYKIARPLAANRAVLLVEFSGQDHIDQWVDQLRQHKVSLQRLEPKRETLEDAFLKMIE